MVKAQYWERFFYWVDKGHFLKQSQHKSWVSRLQYEIGVYGDIKIKNTLLTNMLNMNNSQSVKHLKNFEYLSSQITRGITHLGITFSDLCMLQLSIIDLYKSQCSLATVLKLLRRISSAEFASDNFLQISRAFWGWDFCHFLTAPTIDTVDDPPVPGSSSNCKCITISANERK